MPIDQQLPIEGSDALHGVNSGTHVEGGIQAQLSRPQDITAASEFFKGGMAPSADKFLPPMDATSLATPGVVPGAEQMSPLIQMIMKMPGHISLIGNFFDMLGAFFAPVGDALGDALSGLGEGLGLDLHLGAEGGADLSLDLDGGGDDSALSLDMDGGDSALTSDLLPKDAPIFENELFKGNPSLSDRFYSAPDLNVGGNYSPGKSLFESTGNNLNFTPGAAEFGGGPNTYMAMGPQVDPNGNFGSTIGASGAAGGSGLPQAQYQQMQYQQMQNQQMQNQQMQYQQAAPSGYGDGNFSKVPDAQGAESQMTGKQGDATAAGGDTAAATDASAEPQTEQYTVKSGDNLWDIAKQHFGDGARWPEIYHLNEGVIGSNPSLIMPGTELQLPGGDSATNIAADSAYTVKPGDNLWDISKDHLGGGQHWGDLYKENASTIGSNPDLIHPGDKLHMPDGSTHSATSENLASSHGQHVSHNAHANHISHNANSAHAANANHISHNNQHVSHNTQHLNQNHAAPAHQANNLAQAKGADAGLSKQAASLDKAAPVDQAALTAKATPDLQQKIITPENDLENLSLSAKAQSIDSGT